jgi:hypothetical protein
MDLIEFEKWCTDSWGSEYRDSETLVANGTKQIRNNVYYYSITQQVKLKIAEILILESCKNIGSYCSTEDDIWYICHFVDEIVDNHFGFDGRHLQPIIAALFLLSNIEYGRGSPEKRSDFDHVCAGGGAMVAMYLMAHLEYLFRINSRYLSEDGSIIKKIPNQLKNKLNIKNQTRINHIDQAFTLFLYRNNTWLSNRLKMLDKKILVTKRLKKIRNPVMHGELADPSSEAMFFGLLTAMFYYGSSLKPIEWVSVA